MTLTIGDTVRVTDSYAPDNGSLDRLAVGREGVVKDGPRAGLYKVDIGIDPHEWGDTTWYFTDAELELVA